MLDKAPFAEPLAIPRDNAWPLNDKPLAVPIVTFPVFVPLRLFAIKSPLNLPVPLTSNVKVDSAGGGVPIKSLPFVVRRILSEPDISND